MKLTRRDITKELQERILLLDGALGTMFQQHNLCEEEFRGAKFAEWDKELKGCNDILSLTRPDLVADLAKEYLEAGADIITTNTFNANAISLADYGLEEYAYPISRAAAEILRKEADAAEIGDGRPRFVAGSVGPTNRTASISADVLNPAAREVTFDQLVAAYYTQIEGLWDGGADVIILETIFDTLNAKAAIYAIDKLSGERGERIPTMISGTLTDASGRTLSGQKIEAFYASVSHAQLVSVGFNCAFGAKQMMPYLEELSDIAGCYVSAYPNAGLPNVMGGYDETPEMFMDDVEEYLRRGIINIIGGCCGTTPQHIKLLSELIKRYQPRTLPHPQPTTTLSGLEVLKFTPNTNFVNIGERSNVAGSAKFARLIREEKFEEALSIVRAQVDAGAQVIDVCMDDGMIDGVEAMRHFLCLMGSEPEIARVPTMIDSSKWEVLEAGLKVSQGKSIVNSISLKEGEGSFVSKAMEIHRMGCAVVVMLFDEDGQADTYERKIEIAQRAYNTLTGAGFPSQDIIFDPNVLAVATGIEAHDSYGKAFIDATRWIKTNLPNAKVSGGVSNLSFAFRGNNTVREAMHSVFLYHAIEAGMDMAIVNAQMLQIYDQIEPELLQRIEDVILCRRADGSERLIEFAEGLKGSSVAAKDDKKGDEWRALSLSERIKHAMTKGLTDFIEEDTLEGYHEFGNPMRVIDELLMPAMEYVGRLFGEGKMFLPQVVKTARVMKRAVGVLTPFIEEQKSQSQRGGAGGVVIATVKGDVHDIGKNIVSVVMACNGYEIEDLGLWSTP
ncbi:MAG: methionine synthase [Rikenellaceae bacterium]